MASNASSKAVTWMSNSQRPLHRRLPFLAPEALDEAAGYSLPARYYGLHWQPGGEDVYITDGLSGYTTPGWGFLVFIENYQVVPFLQPYDFGSEEHLPRHMLVIDTRTRQTFAMPLVEARNFLRTQHARQNTHSVALRRNQLLDAIDASLDTAYIDRQEVEEALEQAEVTYPSLEAELEEGLRMALSLS